MFISIVCAIPEQGDMHEVEVAYIYLKADGTIAMFFPNRNFYRYLLMELAESVTLFPILISSLLRRLRKRLRHENYVVSWRIVEFPILAIRR
ncbi:hypothetical protein Aduo_019369 [Ancylostoma duodenale]